MPAGIACTPRPPYYAVIFTSLRTDAEPDAYDTTAGRMVELAARQPGYLGVETARGADGVGITVSYWDSEEHIAAWRRDAEHTIARERGRTGWYAHYEVRVAKVERAYAKAENTDQGALSGTDPAAHASGPENAR
jgi:heme-degrading monooxygenase HmoA